MTQSQVLGNLTLKTATQMSAANCIIIIVATKLCVALFVCFVFHQPTHIITSFVNVSNSYTCIKTTHNS